MKIGYLPTVSIIVSMMLLTISCTFNAERDNILDPQGSGFSSPASISGKVTMKNGTTPIEGVVITTSPGNLAGTTDSNGHYNMNISEPATYQITLSHSGYKTTTYNIDIDFNTHTTHNFTMDAEVVFDSISVTSQYIANGGTALPTKKAYVYVNMFDPDGSTDLDSAKVSVLYLDQALNLTNSSTSIYSNFVSETSCPGYNIENILGVGFVIRVIDNQNDTTYSESTMMRRVLNFGISLYSPDPSQGRPAEGGNHPNFQWYVPTIAPSLYFNYSYRLTIYPKSEPEQIRFETVLPVDSLVASYGKYSYILDSDSLTEGNYYWTVQLEDEVMDITRSPKIEFEVYNQ
jgi:hypothetical protein